MANDIESTAPADCPFCEGTGQYSEIVRDGFIPKVISRDCPRTGHAIKNN